MESWILVSSLFLGMAIVAMMVGSKRKTPQRELPARLELSRSRRSLQYQQYQDQVKEIHAHSAHRGLN